MGFLGNIFGGGPSNDQKQSNNLLNFNAQQATPAYQNSISQGNKAIQSGQQALGTGMNFLHQFSNTLGAPTNYFQNILSGNNANTTSALAPEISKIGGNLNQTMQSTAQLAPRGGGRSSMLFNLPYQAASQTAGVYNQARPQAANALTGIAGQLGSVGLGQEGVGTSLYGTGGSLFNSGANFMQAGNQAAGTFGNQAAQQAEAKRQAGGAGGGFLGNILGNTLGHFFPGVTSILGI